MSEELTENGRINEHGHEELATELPPTPDMNSPRPSVTTPPHGAMEYFDHKGGGSETGSEGGSSPHTQDNLSHHSPSYVTVSPSISPGGRGTGEERNMGGACRSKVGGASRRKWNVGGAHRSKEQRKGM